MLRLKDLPPEEMSEVVRLASEIQDRETDTAREHRATVDAAAEVGISEEYLERAAAEVHARRVAAITEKRRKRRTAVAAGAVLVGVGLIGGGLVVSRKAPLPPRSAPPAAVAVSVDAATLERTAGVQASLAQNNSESVLTVARFTRDSSGTYNANITLAPPKPSLAGYRTANFTLRGTGGLKQIRLDIQNGPTERWKGPLIAVPADKKNVSVSLRDFTYQQRDSSGAPWRSKSYRAPGDVTRLGFKTGDTVNPFTASGSVSVGDLRFE